MKNTTRLIATLAIAGTIFGQDNNAGWRKFEVNEGVPQGGSSAAAPAPAPAPGGNQLTIPAGTWVTVRVNEYLASDRNRQGDAFTATLSQPLIAQGYVVARRGQTIGGQITMAEKGGMVKGTSHLGMELTDLTLVDGQRVPVRTELVQYSGGTSVGRDVAAVGTATGVGAAIGAAVNGGVGAGVGAGIGAAASVIGVLVTRGNKTVVYPEDTLTFRLASPVTISTDGARFAFEPVRQQDYEAQRTVQPRRTVAAPPPPVYGYPGYYGYPPYWGPRVIIAGGRYGRRW